MTRIMKAQASARPKLNCFGSGGSTTAATASAPIVVTGGVVSVAMVALLSSGRTCRPG